MQRAQSREQLWSFTRSWRRDGLQTALVPTMGNLHEGHLELVRAARQNADRVIVSIYVNPTQFGEGEDFDSYPRTLDADLQKLEAEACDLVFVPGNATMYPLGTGQAVQVRAAPELSAILEGDCRPGHFDGVVTVVARLFNLVYPEIAVFGEKDYQQLLVIQQMVEDLGYPLRILPVPTVRESSGLAMSSRNSYLDQQQMQAAVQLNSVLANAARRVMAAGQGPEDVERLAVDELERLGFQVDYVALRRASDLAEPGVGDRDLRILAAAYCGETRLIDNLPVNRS
jgi:pantoate--beta-alanine ligase